MSTLQERLRQKHPMQYGFIGSLMILHTQNSTDPRLTDRLDRCPVCEQWSPCDVIQLADALDAAAIDLSEAKRAWRYERDRADAAQAKLAAIDALPQTLPPDGLATEQFTLGWAAAMHAVHRILHPEEGTDD